MAIYQVSIASPLPHSASVALRQQGSGAALDPDCTEGMERGDAFSRTVSLCLEGRGTAEW